MRLETAHRYSARFATLPSLSLLFSNSVAWHQSPNSNGSRSPSIDGFEVEAGAWRRKQNPAGQEALICNLTPRIVVTLVDTLGSPRM
jgi:hypothetical protein